MLGLYNAPKLTNQQQLLIGHQKMLCSDTNMIEDIRCRSLLFLPSLIIKYLVTRQDPMIDKSLPNPPYMQRCYTSSNHSPQTLARACHPFLSHQNINTVYVKREICISNLKLGKLPEKLIQFSVNHTKLMC